MSEVRAKPRRRLRNEILPLFGVLATPLLLAWIFPYSALSPATSQSASDGGAPATTFSFVELTKEEEARAIAAARTAWHINSEDVRSLRIEMFADDLPMKAYRPVAGVEDRTRTAHDGDLPYVPAYLPSDLRAGSPVVLENPEPPVKPVAFPREEMLKLD